MLEIADTGRDGALLGRSTLPVYANVLLYVTQRDGATRRGDEMARSYSEKDIKLLFTFAAGLCSFRDCRMRCAEPATAWDEAAILGQIAHIVASSDAGPRADPSFPKSERDKYSNLILLCGTHHTLVDRQENTYTIADLRAWKEAHERWVRRRLTDDITDLTFAELEVTCKAIANADVIPSTALMAVPPAQKVQKNLLTNKSENLLRLGLAQANLVAEYLGKISRIDRDFPFRLRGGFVKEYDHLRAAGLVGDDLFLALLRFASDAAGPAYEVRASALAVVAHLFQMCEVFEP